MIEISKNISVEGFKNKEEFNEWLKEQEKNEPNENVLKTFKYFLMQLEEDAKKNVYNENHCNAIDKYASKMIVRKIMSEENVINFIRQAQGLS